MVRYCTSILDGCAGFKGNERLVEVALWTFHNSRCVVCRQRAGCVVDELFIVFSKARLQTSRFSVDKDLHGWRSLARSRDRPPMEAK